jgi:DNA-binding NarL/FixJ family response regulator
MMNRIRLLIVDDHEVVRLGLRTLLEDEPDMEVVAEASSAEQGLQKFEQFRPDVVVMDIQLPGRSGIEACQEICRLHPEAKIVVLTSHSGIQFAEQAFRAGASGFVLKQVGNEELMRAIRAAHKGEMALDPRTSLKMIAQFKELHHGRENQAFADLSNREMEVLSLITRGMSNKEIGAALNLTEVTVRNYTSNILTKLQLRNRIELATYAVQNHIEDHMERDLEE